MTTVGAVLTGGESRRMGCTKALVEVDGVPMATLVARALRDGGCERVVLVGGEAAELAVLGLPVVADLHPGAGPLGGVLSALRHVAPADDVVIVACDLPFLDARSVAALIDAAAGSAAAQVVVASSGRVQPACALWRASSVPTLDACFSSGTRSLHDALGHLVTLEVHLPAEALVNVNRPGDLPGQ